MLGLIRQYCKFQNIEVAGFYKEDHSAKTFERPAFNELLAFLRKNKEGVNLLLFLKCDRFSRNAGDAYSMISRLNKLGVEPHAYFAAGYANSGVLGNFMTSQASLAQSKPSIL